MLSRCTLSCARPRLGTSRFALRRFKKWKLTKPRHGTQIVPMPAAVIETLSDAAKRRPLGVRWRASGHGRCRLGRPCQADRGPHAAAVASRQRAQLLPVRMWTALRGPQGAYPALRPVSPAFRLSPRHPRCPSPVRRPRDRCRARPEIPACCVSSNLGFSLG